MNLKKTYDATDLLLYIMIDVFFSYVMRASLGREEFEWNLYNRGTKRMWSKMLCYLKGGGEDVILKEN